MTEEVCNREWDRPIGEGLTRLLPLRRALVRARPALKLSPGCGNILEKLIYVFYGKIYNSPWGYILMTTPYKSVADFAINVPEELVVLLEGVNEFLEKKVRPLVDKGEAEGEVPGEVRRELSEMGMYGLNAPSDLGGQAGSLMAQVLVTEAVSRVWTSLSTQLFINWLFIHVMDRFGDRQQREVIREVVGGNRLGAFATTEPEAGSDLAGIRTVAERRGDRYLLKGRKIFISNGGIADYYVVTARTSPPGNERWRGISLFLVRKDDPGFSVVSRINTLGLRASHTAELLLDEVELGKDRLVGEEGMGFKHTLESFDHSRVVVASQGVGVAQSALDRMLEYSVNRNTFNRKIAEFQLVQEKVAEAVSDVTAARLMTYWAATLLDRGDLEQGIRASSNAKMFATEAAFRNSQRLIQVMGGYGVSTESAHRLLRDSEVLMTYEGTNDIQRLTIARSVYRSVYGMRV